MLKLALPLLLLAVSAGVSLVIQQALNANLRNALSSAAWSGFMSYFVGMICMAAFALALRDPLPTAGVVARIPWWAWSGGLFGAIFIALAILLIPKLGAATFIALLVAGQMFCSLAFDHFGLLGIPVQPASLVRLAGAAFLIAGVVLIRMWRVRRIRGRDRPHSVWPIVAKWRSDRALILRQQPSVSAVWDFFAWARHGGIGQDN